MPIRVQNDLPVKRYWNRKYICDGRNPGGTSGNPSDQYRALNLMPLKEDTELQILRSLSNTPLQVDVTFVRNDKPCVKEHIHQPYL